jgi:predicted Zn-dependent peptidase
MFSSASLSNIDREDLINFHRRFFQPNNIMFAVTGDITKEQAINLFTKYFGKWKKGTPANQTSLPAPTLQAGLYFIDKDIPQSTIVCGQFAPGKHDPDYYAFTVLEFITGSGGFNSRIFDAVRNNKGLAYSAGSLYRPRSTFGLFVAYAFTKTSSTMQTLSLINTILDDIKRGTLTANELDWAKQSINNGFIFSFSSVQDIAWQQMKSEFEKMPPDYLARYRERIEKVTLEDLNRLAGLYLDKSNNIVLILGDYENFDKPADINAEPVIIKPQE